MATPNADTSEIRRKGRQRLIGAVTIVLLLVVFVPMLLDPEPRQDKKEPVLAIPPKDGAAPLPTPAPARPASPALAPVEAKPSLADTTKSSIPPKAPEAPKVETAKVTEKAAEAPKAAEPAKPAAEPAKPAAAAMKLEGFAVQVGAFGDEEKLRQAREKLAAARITHFIERLPSGLTRLRAGPYTSREEAEKATAGVKAAGLDGKVVPLP
jgi:DedD protein